ncbi:hypothetical protein EL22_06680 [Halostagnicola sp. A56]|uniref:hypothetical protein n=1 Tax=Halostagnicola sp. A56 TaxID=1495067 RepID=UPI0004A0327F|nr:hypothetical protein [Halostagnicola sp. A56]KDE58197.1 hypothetical protein EL22_06680 [Halostagnicola sp. A56]
MKEELKRRLFRFDHEGWNNPWYGFVAAPILTALGISIGELFGVHLVSSALGEDLIVILCMVVTIVVGFTGVALIDMGR